MSFNQFVLREQYQKVRGLGDRLELMKREIDWQPFRPLVRSVFHDNEISGGRPHTDELVIVRVLLLQGWYGLSDPELEFQVNDRLSFRNFVGFPETVPDFSTVWKIREKLNQAGVQEKIWNELQSQLDAKGYKIEKGVIQDATFVEADLGKKRYSREKRAKKEGNEIIYSEKQLSHIDKDATFAIKSNQIHFGYKSHIKTDIDHHLVRDVKVTPANIHDNNIDLCQPDDIAMYRDRGYSGSQLKYPQVNDMTMIRKDKNKDWVQSLNKAISKVRCPGERPFSVIKEVFNGTRTKVKNLARVSIKETFKYFAYNLYQLVTLTRKKLATAIK